MKVIAYQPIKTKLLSAFRIGLSLWLCLAASASLRLTLPYGKPLGPEYSAFPWQALGLSAGLALMVVYLSWKDFRQYLYVLAITSAFLLLGMESFSQLQVLFFVLIALLWGAVWHQKVPQLLGQLDKPLAADFAAMWRFRHLYSLWLLYRLQMRYSQTILGVIWVVLLPLVNVLVLTFALEVVLQSRVLEGVPYIPFLFCGQMIYSFFSAVLLKARESVLNNISLAHTAYFPRSFSILLLLGEAMVDLGIMLLVALVINLLHGIGISWVYIFLPLPLFILIAFTCGLAFLLSYWGIVVRDLQQILSIILQLLFFLLPIFYPISRVPSPFDLLLWFNPLAQLIECLRSIFFQGNFNPSLVFVPSLWAVSLLALGYLFFRIHEQELSDYI